MDDASPFEPTVPGAMWKYRRLVILILLAAMSLAVVYALLRPVNYQATATLVVEDPRANSLFETSYVPPPQRYVADQAAILSSVEVGIRAVEAEESLGDPEDVVEATEVFWDQDSNVIDVVFTSDQPDSAVVGVNTVASAYSQLRHEVTVESSQRALAQLDTSIDGVEAQLENVQTQINAILRADPARESLEVQLSEALARLVSLQGELPTVSGSALAQARDELDDVLQQIQTMQLLTSLESQDPEVIALFDEQREAVSHKADLIQRRDELNVQSQAEGFGIVLYSPAMAALGVGADWQRFGAVGLVAGLLLSAGTAYLLAIRKRTFDERSQPESVLQVPLLGDVPNFRAERIKGDLAVMSHPASVSAEAFRFISAAIDVEMEQGSLVNSGAHMVEPGPQLVRSFAVVSPNLDDGKTVVAANLALASARLGKRVLLIDADFGHQRLADLLTGETQTPDVGLTDVVERGVSYTRAVFPVPLKEGARLDLLARGSVPTTAPDFFRSKAAQTFFEGIRDEYDLVVIDTPPLLRVAYATHLVRYADRVVVVVRHGGSVNPVEDLADRLALLETDVMGYVYNKGPFSDEAFGTEGSLEDVLGRVDQSRRKSRGKN